MPPRDEHDYEARRQQIIDAALQVFSSEGFEKATNKDIARAARIKSPGLIYHYFKDKTDLFRQVVEERAPALQFILHGDEMLDLPPREVLTEFAQTFVAMLDNRASVAMFNHIAPMRGVAFLTRYLEHQMDLGTLRRMDSGAAARCLMGPLIAFVLTREVFVQADAATLTSKTMAQTAVDVFLNGMAATHDSRSG